EQVEVTAHGRFAYPQRSRWIGRAPDPAMPMGDHCPKPQQRRSRNPNTQLRYVALEKSLNELSPPGRAVFIGSRKERQREPAPLPVATEGLRADFGEAEPRHGNRFEPA